MDRFLALALVAIVTVVVAGYVLLAVNRGDLAQYAVFLGGPLVTTIVGSVLAQRTAKVEKIVTDVRHQTNSILTGRLDSLDTQLAAAVDDRAVRDHITP